MRNFLILLVISLLFLSNSLKADSMSDGNGTANIEKRQKEMVRQEGVGILLGKTVEAENPEVTRGVPTLFVVYVRNATTALYLNGKKVPWQNSEYSLKTPGGVSVIKYSVSVPVKQEENVVGICSFATGSSPGLRIEAGREETDKKWKAGMPEDDKWFEAGFDDSAWPLSVPASPKYSWGSQDDVNNPSSYAWGADPAAKKVCFRQVIRGIEKLDQDVKYTVYDWGKPLDGLGYHRAIVRVPEDAGKSVEYIGRYEQRAPDANAVWAHIPWRRRDANPEQKAIFIHDSKTGKRIENFEIINLNREYLDVVFEPLTVPGDYEIYYLPYFERYNIPSYWETIEEYVKPYNLCDGNWLARVSWRVGNSNAITPKIADGHWQRLPKAGLVEIQSKTGFDSFYPMEVPATREEVAEIIVKNRKSEYLVFPEDRKYPVRMFETIPLKWAKTGPSTEFRGEAQPGEYYFFQIGVFAVNSDIRNISVNTGGLKNGKGNTIPASKFCCINTSGLDVLGKSFNTTFNMLKGKVRPLWVGFQVPDNGKGVYTGTVVVKPEGMGPTTINVSLNVAGDVIADKGDNELWRLSRLRWLNSTLGLNDEELVPPYTPLKVSGNEIRCLNRSVVFGSAGMPQTITSNGKDVLAAPMKFDVIVNGKAVSWKKGSPDKTILNKPARVIRESTVDDGLLQLKNQITMEADGMVRFDITLHSKEDVSIDAIRVETPFNMQVAKYLLGAGQPGGFRPEKADWKAKKDAKIWMGDYDAGMQLNFFDQTNGSITEDQGIVVVKAETGKLTVKKEKGLTFSFRLFITPFKPIDNNIHWNTRTQWKDRVMDKNKYNWLNKGGNIVHYHHGTPENPLINYPFLTTDELTSAQDSIVKKGGYGVQLYYGAPAISNRAVELWAIRSLGTEVLEGMDVYNTADVPPLVVGHPWLREHLVNGFSRRWACPMAPGVVDHSIKQTTLSRWYNYYIEGLNLLMRKGCMCSLYLDGIAYDREIMKRVARSLAKANPEYRMEFHGTAGSLSDKMEHLPYLTKLWMGEFVNYNLSPDYWLVEISGLPFGVTSEMLDFSKTANPWRGMIYGMNDRTNPQWARPLYKLWDDFGIEGSEWIGYWDPKCPVKTGRDDIMATVYKKQGKSMICLASWANEDVDIKLAIDWKSLGLDPLKTVLTAPMIENMQEFRTFNVGDNLPVKKSQGLILIAR